MSPPADDRSWSADVLAMLEADTRRASGEVVQAWQRAIGDRHVVPDAWALAARHLSTWSALHQEIAIGDVENLQIGWRSTAEGTPPASDVSPALWHSWCRLRLTLKNDDVTRRPRKTESGADGFALPLVEWLLTAWQEVASPTDGERHSVSDQAVLLSPLPHLSLRRWGDRLEVIWRNEELSQPQRYWPPTRHSVHYLEAPEALDALLAWAREVVRSLPPADDPDIARLRKALGALRVRRHGDQPLLPPAARRVLAKRRLSVDEPVRVLFGSAAPSIDEADVTTLLDLLAAHESTTAGESSILLSLRREAALSPREPWVQGYELAHEALHRLNMSEAVASPVDVHAALEVLGVPVREVILRDNLIRGVALGLPGRQPLVALNRLSSHYARDAMRRFSLAHELCHVLYDRNHARPLAVIDNPWAADRLEQRANAFAAMFLMPPERVKVVIAGVRTLDQQAKAVARTLQTSITAAREHVAALRRNNMI